MKIGTRLALGFGFVLAMLIGIGISGYRGANSISNATVVMLNGDANVAELAARGRANVLGLRQYEKDMFINIGAKDKEEEYFKKGQDDERQYPVLNAEGFLSISKRSVFCATVCKKMRS